MTSPKDLHSLEFLMTLQESLEDYVKNSKPLMDKFYAKSIQGTAYLPGNEENEEKVDDKKED